MREESPRSLRTCLIVGDGVATAGVVRALHMDGFAVLERPRTGNAVALALSGEFDLICWSCEAADSETLTALSKIADGGLPLIALTREPEGRLMGDALLAGADACLSLDADPIVVRGQAHAVMRRVSPVAPRAEVPSRLRVGRIVIDTVRCEVRRDGIPVPLTANEFRVLVYMAQYPGRAIPAQEILNAVSDGYLYTAREAQDIFKATARRIRRKLEPDESVPVHLVTVRGFGYRLEGGERGARVASA